MIALCGIGCAVFFRIAQAPTSKIANGIYLLKCDALDFLGRYKTCFVHEWEVAIVESLLIDTPS